MASTNARMLPHPCIASPTLTVVKPTTTRNETKDKASASASPTTPTHAPTSAAHIGDANVKDDPKGITMETTSVATNGATAVTPHTATSAAAVTIAAVLAVVPRLASSTTSSSIKTVACTNNTEQSKHGDTKTTNFSSLVVSDNENSRKWGHYNTFFCGAKSAFNGFSFYLDESSPGTHPACIMPSGKRWNVSVFDNDEKRSFQINLHGEAPSGMVVNCDEPLFAQKAFVSLHYAPNKPLEYIPWKDITQDSKSKHPTVASTMQLFSILNETNLGMFVEGGFQPHWCQHACLPAACLLFLLLRVHDWFQDLMTVSEDGRTPVWFYQRRLVMEDTSTDTYIVPDDIGRLFRHSKFLPASTSPIIHFPAIVRVYRHISTFQVRVSRTNPSDSVGSESVGLYPSIHKLKHSCLPNCHLVPSSHGTVVFSSTHLRSGDELTVNAISSNVHPYQRFVERVAWFGHPCSCTVCRFEGTVLNSVRDDFNKAYVSTTRTDNSYLSYVKSCNFDQTFWCAAQENMHPHQQPFAWQLFHEFFDAEIPKAVQEFNPEQRQRAIKLSNQGQHPQLPFATFQEYSIPIAVKHGIYDGLFEWLGRHQTTIRTKDDSGHALNYAWFLFVALTEDESSLGRAPPPPFWVQRFVYNWIWSLPDTAHLSETTFSQLFPSWDTKNTSGFWGRLSRLFNNMVRWLSFYQMQLSIRRILQIAIALRSADSPWLDDAFSNTKFELYRFKGTSKVDVPDAKVASSIASVTQTTSDGTVHRIETFKPAIDVTLSDRVHAYLNSSAEGMLLFPCSS